MVCIRIVLALKWIIGYKKAPEKSGAFNWGGWLLDFRTACAEIAA